ncbi:hypothetical protein O0I10_008372 [Lichtheimia ornata]|uniref:Uncharacterized protein n=1 Tax=Lichtheimia ornata TaxID=688661 RepID=A0AAD7UYR7_9FUNG|nr:uncharacterized protein O0I10_008372 [Lichtheimia ornata]KAJ8655932.1 hypothetical protein O0I10_008372 [Lichtheimia ornata]
MPATTIPGDRFIRTLSHYLDANQGRLIVGKRDERRSSTTSGSQPRSSTSSSSSTTPASLYGLSVPYMSLLAAATPTSALRTTSYMPSSTLSLDMHHLYFLLVHFEHVGLDMGDPARLGSVPEDGIVNEEDTSHQDETRSIMSVGSITSTLSLSTGWNFWQRQWSDQQQQQRTVFQDVEHIYQMVAQVDAVRLQMQNTRLIQGYQEPLPSDATFSLVPFKHMTHLELVNVHPRLLADIPTHALTTLIVREAGVEDAAEVITSESDFGQLRMLSLAGNNLITLDDAVTQRIHATVTHLDLSTNMLADVPHALSLLYNLTSLVLAHNMISSVTGINTVLGNIYELDLRGNRLTMLVGLDRLWSLKRLDLRDNRIEDWSELTRLVSLPNLEDVWVAGNPFTVNDYRVDIFAAFHQHADHDIQLDGSRPSFIERRRIENTPASKLRQLQDQNHAPQPTVATTATAKPSKVVRAKSKRFVKLGRQQQQEETPPPVPPLPPSAAAPPAPPSSSSSSQQDTTAKENHDKRVNRATELEKTAANITRRKSASSSTRRSRRSTRRSRSPSTTANAVTDDEEQEKQARHRSLSPTSFRRKIESMRQEAGTEWLRVFQEMDIGNRQH